MYEEVTLDHHEVGWTPAPLGSAWEPGEAQNFPLPPLRRAQLRQHHPWSSDPTESPHTPSSRPPPPRFPLRPPRGPGTARARSATGGTRRLGDRIAPPTGGPAANGRREWQPWRRERGHVGGHGGGHVGYLRQRATVIPVRAGVRHQ